LKQEEILQFLKKVSLFKNISEAGIRPALDFIEIGKYQKGENIIREGEKGDSLFFLFEGQVSVSKKMTLLSSRIEMGQLDKALIKLKDSDHAFFGEMAICGEGEVRSATVTAETDCILGELSAETIHRMTEKNYDFGLNFYRNLSGILADRLRKANRDILKLTTALTLALEE
ncbi:MAG: cyclic nucleotide-binding domain-containing protein, partial [Calditrichaeota bacterium]